MDRRGVLTGVVALGFVLTVALVGVLGVSGVSGGLLGAGEAGEPVLQSFESAGAQCTDDFVANSSVSVTGGGANTEITYARNISLEDPSVGVDLGSFERKNESTYVLDIATEETKKPPRDCTGVARYEAQLRIPAGDDRWRIVVKHDGETVTTLFGDSNSTGASGSASAGGQVSS